MEASSTRVTDRASRPRAVALAMILATIPCRAALAQTTPSAARADQLFTQGKAALEAGDYAHACPDLSESYRIDPAAGTLLALALCHEGMGLTATAWREFGTAVDGATKDGRADRAQFARTHMAKLEAKLSRLTLLAPGDAPPGLRVDVDGVTVTPGDLGKATPIDPGHHTIEARATGFRPWTGAVDVGADHDSETVKIGPLASDAPAPVATPAPASAAPAPAAEAASTNPSSAPEEQPTPGAWKRPAGWIVGGAGVVAIGVGTYFGLSAISKSNDAKRQCTPSLCTSPGAVSENNDAKTYATVSDVAIGAGLAVVAAGAYLLITAPSGSPATGALVTPFVGRQQAGLSLQASF